MRSPHAHAKIGSIDTSAAESAPGVVAVLTWKDVEAFGANPMPCMAPLKSRDGSPVRQSPKPLLAKDKVTFVGEAIAMVVAETYAQAVDAAELVEIDYEPLDARGTLAAAPGGPQIWESAPDNECFDWAAGDEEKTNAAFAAAAHVVSVDTVQNRIAPTSMETRNAIGLYDAEKDFYTLYSGNQGSGGLRDRVAKGVLNIPVEKLRVINKDVGGGFGMKGFMYPEQPLVLIAAKKVGRPVRWSSDRTEAFLTDDHGRDMITTRRTRARQGRQNPRDARDRHGEHGRLSVAVRAVHPDAGRRPHLRRRLSRAGGVREREGLFLQLRARSTPIAAPAGPKRPI